MCECLGVGSVFIHFCWPVDLGAIIRYAMTPGSQWSGLDTEGGGCPSAVGSVVTRPRRPCETGSAAFAAARQHCDTKLTMYLI